MSKQSPPKKKPATAMPRRLVRIDAAALYLGMSEQTVRALVHKGELHNIQRVPGAPWLLDLNEMDLWVERHRVPYVSARGL